MNAKDYLVRRSRCRADHGRRNLQAVLEICGGYRNEHDKSGTAATGKGVEQGAGLLPVYCQPD